MLSKEEFENLKGNLLRCSPEQSKAVEKILRATKPEPPQGGGDATEFYEVLRSALGDGTSFSAARRAMPWLPSDLETASKELEHFLDQEFAKSTRQERTAVRNLLVGMAATAYAPPGLHRLEKLIGVLMSPEQLVDEAFPGYRKAGILREYLLRYVRKGRWVYKAEILR